MRCRICKNLRKGKQLDNVRFAVYGCAASTYRHIDVTRISTRIVSLEELIANRLPNVSDYPSYSWAGPKNCLHKTGAPLDKLTEVQ